MHYDLYKKERLMEQVYRQIPRIKGKIDHYEFVPGFLDMVEDWITAQVS